VFVASNTTPVPNAQVIVSADAGNFSATTGFTDSNGYCRFVFNAPSTSKELPVSIAANVTKSGYQNGANQTTLIVIPKTVVETGGGWSTMTLLLVIIAVAIVVIVVAVLIKLKILAFSFGKKGGGQE
jgi:hypothetical protein